MASPSQASLLLQKQLKDLCKNPVDGFSAGLVDEANIFELGAIVIGPTDTLYFQFGMMISLLKGYNGCSLLLLSLPQVSGSSIDHMSCFSDSAGRLQESGDLIPLCTPETGAMAAYASKFEERGVKLLGLPCDDVQSQKEWIKDIEAFNDTEEAICSQMDRVLFGEKEYCCWGNSSEATMRSTLDVFFAKTKAIEEQNRVTVAMKLAEIRCDQGGLCFCLFM